MKRARIDWMALHDAAQGVLVRAYAPYSSFPVAAALLASDGRVFTGVNVENASFGLTLCAERGAIAAAVAAGARRFDALVVVVPAPRAASPCGACRQVLSEFAPAFPIRCYGTAGRPLQTNTAVLLPRAFGPGHVTAKRRQTER